MTTLPVPGPVPVCLHVFCPVWMCYIVHVIPDIIWMRYVRIVGRSLIFISTRRG